MGRALRTSALALLLGAACSAPAKPEPAITNTVPAPRAAEPAAPDAARYAQLPPDQRCAAVAPRAVPCVDQLMVQDVARVMDDPDLKSAIVAKLRASPPSTPASARRIHEAMCLASTDSDYADAVLACWYVTACEPFTACVTAHRKH